MDAGRESERRALTPRERWEAVERSYGMFAGMAGDRVLSEELAAERRERARRDAQRDAQRRSAATA
jgi:hypothetical protein